MQSCLLMRPGLRYSRWCESWYTPTWEGEQQWTFSPVSQYKCQVSLSIAPPVLGPTAPSSHGLDPKLFPLNVRRETASLWSVSPHSFLSLRFLTCWTPLLSESWLPRKSWVWFWLSAKFWELLLGLAGDNHEAGAVGGGDEPTEENRLIRTLVKIYSNTQGQNWNEMHINNKTLWEKLFIPNSLIISSKMIGHHM